VRVAVLAALAALLIAPPAWAFCRTTTCNPDDQDCRRNDHECVRDGAPARWADGPITYRFAESTPEDVRVIFREEAGLWTWASCPNARDARTGLRLVETDETDDADAGFVVSVEDGVGAKGELGLTTLDFGGTSGVVRSAKIRIDSSVIGDDEALRVVAAHEIGHYIGLAHSKEEGSVMRETYASIDPASARKLEKDDTTAVCALYPPAPLKQLPSSCSMTMTAMESDSIAPFGVFVTVGCLVVASVRRRHFASAVISAGVSARE
jgi:hypothetical protein